MLVTLFDVSYIVYKVRSTDLTVIAFPVTCTITGFLLLMNRCDV